MPNRLALETSPYLRQHAGNPVNWLPWGGEAFGRARSEQKPIFLSIGYSTCHWCHVMAHESFENVETAVLLNENFVPIKVDREERPDVDRVYMSFVQALTGQGGWPLSVWLTPTLKPFYGGTYFPPDDRYGRPGFPSVLRSIARGWKEDRLSLEEHGETLVASLRGQLEGKRDGRPGLDLAEAASDAFEACFEALHRSFDPERGGFGGAPKFPRASNLDFLFRCAAIQGVGSDAGREAVGMAVPTVRCMARGGIHDHVGGGFHRYSVDEDWFVPHFEKMLYDQAQIAVNALEAWQATGDGRHIWLARDILDYVLRDLEHEGGGFYSAEDADSPVGDAGAHAEGAFYVWKQAEIEEILGADAAFFCFLFSVQPGGNVPAARDPNGEFTGHNILAQGRPLADAAKEAGIEIEAASELVARCLERLRAARSKRPRPQLDDKILTAWNGLMISALAKAGQVLRGTASHEGTAYIAAGRRAAEFIERELFDKERGVLFRSWRETRGSIEGFAEDYAFLIQGLLDLCEASFDVHWLQWAEQLQHKMDELFWDSEGGGYFNSAAGVPDILIRLKDDYDGAEPAPSSVAAANLLRLAAALESKGTAYRDRGLRTLAAFEPRWSEIPQAMPRMLCALALALEPPRQVVLAGDPASPGFQAMAAVLAERLGPHRSILAADGGSAQAWLAARAPWIGEMRPLNGRVTAYVCENFACQSPASTPEELRQRLAAGGPVNSL
ncbi:MAG: thioredoxin domain-containing protein [Opitutaceae bacterium]|jgi:uncharacterized protein YyaL (SSP411 family)